MSVWRKSRVVAQLERALMPDMQQEGEEYVSFTEAGWKFN